MLTNNKWYIKRVTFLVENAQINQNVVNPNTVESLVVDLGQDVNPNTVESLVVDLGQDVNPNTVESLVVNLGQDVNPNTVESLVVNLGQDVGQDVSRVRNLRNPFTSLLKNLQNYQHR
jgi:hypothetical protein